jgi:hypothetical protein
MLTITTIIYNSTEIKKVFYPSVPEEPKVSCFNRFLLKYSEHYYFIVIDPQCTISSVELGFEFDKNYSTNDLSVYYNKELYVTKSVSKGNWWITNINYLNIGDLFYIEVYSRMPIVNMIVRYNGNTKKILPEKINT